MQHKVLYTSDIHGNEIRYSKLIQYAIKISADTISIGEILLPKEGLLKIISNLREIF